MRDVHYLYSFFVNVDWLWLQTLASVRINNAWLGLLCQRHEWTPHLLSAFIYYLYHSKKNQLVDIWRVLLPEQRREAMWDILVSGPIPQWVCYPPQPSLSFLINNTIIYQILSIQTHKYIQKGDSISIDILHSCRKIHVKSKSPVGLT